MRVDEIRRELVVEAPIEQVWEALTTPEHLSKWFGDSAEVDLRPGGRARFGWSEFNDSSEAIVEVVDRPSRFSFRWEALRDTPVEQASTLVESGFAALPEDAYDHRFEENSSGWTAELKDLSVYLAAVSSVG